MAPTQTWLKMAVVGIGICVGGPLFVQSIRPTDEQLLARVPVEHRNEQGSRRAQDFDNYVNRLKEWSKSDKSIWIAAKEQEEERRAKAEMERRKLLGENAGQSQREEMRRELLGESERK